MKENLKIETQNKRDNAEATKLFRELGYLNVFADELNVYAIAVPSNKDPRTVSFDELRELARPKEYLNDKFELVVTNQPEDGWIEVPDGAKYFSYYPISSKVKRFFIFKGDCRYIWDSTFSDWVLLSSQVYHQVLWKRKENKVETVKGRFLHQEWYEAFGRGEDLLLKMINNKSTVLQVNSAMGLHIFDDANNHFSLKPKTIQIGSRTINKPISVKPEKDSYYYVPDIVLKDKYYKNTWYDSGDDNRHFNNGICFVSQIDAIAMTDALLELMK